MRFCTQFAGQHGNYIDVHKIQERFAYGRCFPPTSQVRIYEQGNFLLFITTSPDHKRREQQPHYSDAKAEETLTLYNT